MTEIKELKEYSKYEAQGILLQEEVLAIQILSHTDLSSAEWLQKKAQKARIEIESTRKELVKPYNDIVWQINSKARDLTLPIETAEKSIKIKMITFQQEEERKRQEKEKLVQECIRKIREINNEEELQKLIISFWEIEDNRIYIACDMQNMEFERRKKEAEEKLIREAEESRLAEIAKIQSEEWQRLAKEKVELERQQRELEEERNKKEQEKLQRETEQTKVMPVHIKWQRKVMKFTVIDENKVPRNLCSPDEKKIRAMVTAWIKEISGVNIREEDAIY